MTAVLEALAWLARVLALFLAATVVFDVIHVGLHRCAASAHPWLRRVGALHETHHAWFDRSLRHDPALDRANLRRHVIPEYLTHATVSLALLAWLPASVVLPVLALQTGVAALILRSRGYDVNHRPCVRVRAPRPSWLCLPDYHRLHHVHPDAHFGSWLKLLDQVAGTALSLDGRRVVLVGSAEALRAALVAAGAAPLETLPSDARADDAASDAVLARADVLVLGAARARDAERVERLCARARDRLEPPEVWALDPAPDWAPHARRYWSDPRVIYRHVPGPVRAGTLFWLRRGAHYAPSTPRAALDFPRFRWGSRPAPHLSGTTA